MREPAQLGQMPAQGEELVDGLVDRIAHQVAHDVFDLRPAVDPGRPSRPAGRCRGPPLAQDQSRQLVLLGHVIQLVPLEVGAVIAARGTVGQGEEPDLDPVHRLLPAAGRPMIRAMASSCSR